MTTANSGYGTRRRLPPRGDTESSYACRMHRFHSGRGTDVDHGGFFSPGCYAASESDHQFEEVEWCRCMFSGSITIRSAEYEIANVEGWTYCGQAMRVA